MKLTELRNTLRLATARKATQYRRLERAQSLGNAVLCDQIWARIEFENELIANCTADIQRAGAQVG